jgi:hypothetical protein
MADAVPSMEGVTGNPSVLTTNKVHRSAPCLAAGELYKQCHGRRQ